MKSNEQLINNLMGQLNGIKKMMEENKDCFLILTQIKAVKAGLNALTNKFLQENFIKCLKKCDSEEGICKKFFKEIVS